MTTQQKFWIGTSWKMHKTLAEAELFVRALVLDDGNRNPLIQRFVIPAFMTVREVADQLSNTSVLVGAQNMHWADQGAWTGEVSPLMLTDGGLDLVELGHSERREHFGETDETVGLKVEAALRHGLIPLVCIGETGPERDAGKATDVLEKQVKAALAHVTDTQKTQPILFAYEPVWAIGENGSPATATYADARQAEIIEAARDQLGRVVPCLYGGSVSPENCTDLISQPHIDGLFIGRSAWHVDGYLDILNRCSAVL